VNWANSWKVIAERINKFLEETEGFNPEQHEFRETRSTIDAILRVKEIVDH